MTTNQYDPFWSAIERALSSRGKTPGDYDRDPEHRECNYVVRMCKGLLALIHAAGATSTTLADVLRIERTAAGHSDYQRKLALYCYELRQKELA